MARAAMVLPFVFAKVFERRGNPDRAHARYKERMAAMKQFDYTVKDELGIHARPAGLLVKEANRYISNISIARDSQTASAKKIFSVMGLGVKCGETVTIIAEGEDEATAIQALQALVTSAW